MFVSSATPLNGTQISINHPISVNSKAMCPNHLLYMSAIPAMKTQQDKFPLSSSANTYCRGITFSQPSSMLAYSKGTSGHVFYEVLSDNTYWSWHYMNKSNWIELHASVCPRLINVSSGILTSMGVAPYMTGEGYDFITTVIFSKCNFVPPGISDCVMSLLSMFLPHMLN